jgi:hypothetical protein
MESVAEATTLPPPNLNVPADALALEWSRLGPHTGPRTAVRTCATFSQGIFPAFKGQRLVTSEVKNIGF